MGNPWVLQVLRLPARLTVEEAGVLLGFHRDSIYYLAKKGMLRALGEVDDVQMFFAAVHIRRLCSDEKWLARATDAVRAHNRAKNAAQKSRHLGASHGRASESVPTR
jgi:hypothetical protein